MKSSNKRKSENTDVYWGNDRFTSVLCSDPVYGNEKLRRNPQSVFPVDWESTPEFSRLKTMYEFYINSFGDRHDTLRFSSTARISRPDINGNWFTSTTMNVKDNTPFELKSGPGMLTAEFIISEIFNREDDFYYGFTDLDQNRIPLWMAKSFPVFFLQLEQKVPFIHDINVKFSENKDIHFREQNFYITNAQIISRLMTRSLQHLTVKMHKGKGKYAIFDAHKNLLHFIGENGNHLSTDEGGYSSEFGAFSDIQSNALEIQRTLGPELADSYMFWMTSQSFQLCFTSQQDFFDEWRTMNEVEFDAITDLLNPNPGGYDYWYVIDDPINRNAANRLLNKITFLTYLQKEIIFDERMFQLQADMDGAHKINKIHEALLNKLAQILSRNPDLILFEESTFRNLKYKTFLSLMEGKLMDYLTLLYANLWEEGYNWGSVQTEQIFHNHIQFMIYDIYQTEELRSSSNFAHFFYTIAHRNIGNAADYPAWIFPPLTLNSIASSSLFFGAFENDLNILLPEFQDGWVINVPYIMKSEPEVRLMMNRVILSDGTLSPIGHPDSRWKKIWTDNKFDSFVRSIKPTIIFQRGNPHNFIRTPLFPSTRTEISLLVDANPGVGVHYSLPDVFLQQHDDHLLVIETKGTASLEKVLEKDIAMYGCTVAGIPYIYVYSYNHDGFNTQPLQMVGHHGPGLSEVQNEKLLKLFGDSKLDQSKWLPGASNPPNLFELCINLRKMALSDASIWGFSEQDAIDIQNQMGIVSHDDTGEYWYIESGWEQFWLNYLCSDGHNLMNNNLPLSSTNLPVVPWVGRIGPVPNTPDPNVQVHFNEDGTFIINDPNGDLTYIPCMPYLYSHYLQPSLLETYGRIFGF